MRIAIASSGLGHVARGIETWAVSTAEALARIAGDGPQAGRLSGGGGIEVMLFAGGPVPCAAPSSVCVLPCLRRGGRAARWLARWSPGFAWRWGLKNPYGWEQFSFWLRLWPRLVRGRYDILHVQDPMVADWCRRFRRAGLVNTREILGHGTEEPAAFLARFEFVQHLAPWHLGQFETTDHRPQTADREKAGVEGEGWRAEGEGVLAAIRSSVIDRPRSGLRLWAAIPNSVDCDSFRPARGFDERLMLRRRFGIPDGAFVVGCVAAVKKDHKRVDYLIREVGGCGAAAATSTLHPAPSTLGHSPLPFLLIAGARTPETPELQALAERLIPGRHRILLDCARDEMPDLCRAMDVFVLPSLFEMMPIALLEALASGLPCLVNRHPVLEWMIGEGQGASAGLAIDMGREGELAAVLAALTPGWAAQCGAAARARAERVFSEEVVIRQYVEYYRCVMRAGRNG